METTLTITEARRDLSRLVDRLLCGKESALITRAGEPVARVVPIGPPPVTGAQLADKWDSMAHLTAEDAAEMERDILDMRARLNVPPVSQWD